ncbi:protein of unknown function [Methylocaldum szegediense]|uniref:Uncharacterized protein n=1 Tax=Methylocaldum szegediense TaxID=73780 RepID=A0ABM9HXI0_9GAMM|nr:protein of unknown function [Methylocaldum szegediense]
MVVLTQKQQQDLIARLDNEY